MNEITPNAGRWIALIDEQVVGVGHTAEEALSLAGQARPNERPTLVFEEQGGGEPLSFSAVMDRLRPHLRLRVPVYLVGGAVRDALLGRVSHDLDFVVPEDGIRLSFAIANRIGEPAYILDKERDTGRVVLAEQATMLDFACFRGPDLEADLRARDFTVNALAIPATARTRLSIIDPSGGLEDLDARRIRITSMGALESDPVRTLRAVRLAANLDFTITEETRKAIMAAGPRLADVSAERKRDELIKIVMTPEPDETMRELDGLGLLAITLPEIESLAGTAQSPPHYEDVLHHTWSVLDWLARLETALFFDASGDEVTNEARSALQAYIERLEVYFERPVDGGLNGQVILRLAALFHDVGKPEKYEQDDDGRIRFFGHDEAGAKLAGYRLRQLCFSNDAINQVKQIVAGHMRPLSLVQAQGANPSRRAVYRYFRDLDNNGLDVALLALADHLATYNGPGEAKQWESLLGLVAQLFQFYFERHEEAVKPVPLLSGRDVIDQLQIEPGPEVGRILRLIEEGQAAGEIQTRDEALNLARQQLA